MGAFACSFVTLSQTGCARTHVFFCSGALCICCSESPGVSRKRFYFQKRVAPGQIFRHPENPEPFYGPLRRGNKVGATGLDFGKCRLCSLLTAECRFRGPGVALWGPSVSRSEAAASPRGGPWKAWGRAAAPAGGVDSWPRTLSSPGWGVTATFALKHRVGEPHAPDAPAPSSTSPPRSPGLERLGRRGSSSRAVFAGLCRAPGEPGLLCRRRPWAGAGKGGGRKGLALVRGSPGTRHSPCPRPLSVEGHSVLTGTRRPGWLAAPTGVCPGKLLCWAPETAGFLQSWAGLSGETTGAGAGALLPRGPTSLGLGLGQHGPQSWECTHPPGGGDLTFKESALCSPRGGGGVFCKR